MRILFVDDDRRLCSVVKRGLIEEAYAVDVAYDGDEGEYCAEVNSYDLIILDIMMPKKDGIEVCQELRTKKINIPILMLTAKDAVEKYKKIITIDQRDYSNHFFRKNSKNTIIYCSPLVRAVQTAAPFMGISHKVHYDPRLREQEWGNFQQALTKDVRKERYKFGTFFYRFPHGESGADVYDRISSFFETMYRDFEKPDFPPNVLISTHGLTAKVFLMRWFHWSVEQFEYYDTPDNCQILVMEMDKNAHPSNNYQIKYNLLTPLKPRVD